MNDEELPILNFSYIDVGDKIANIYIIDMMWKKTYK